MLLSSSPRDAARGFYGWPMLAGLSLAQVVSWGVLFYSFAVFVRPIEAETGWTRSQVTGAFSVALLVSGVASVVVGHWLDARGARGLMTAGSVAGCVVLMATSALLHSAAFWLGRTESAGRQLYESTLMFSLYPDTLFTGPIRWILFTVIPAGFVGYLPAELIRAPSALTAAELAVAVIAYALLAAWVFKRGLRAYSSGSRFATFG